MSEPAEAWAGEFGAAYTQRNRVNWRGRVPFWREVLDATGARSVYEAGTNSGWNLWAINYAEPRVKLQGCELNSLAAQQARNCGLDVACGRIHSELNWRGPAFDLVFTAGVLIHIPPAELHATMQAIANASADYVLAVEYHAEQEEEVLYRGQSGMLWRRPYGKLYEAMGLQLVKEWDAGAGFDKCLATLLRKPVTP